MGLVGILFCRYGLARRVGKAHIWLLPTTKEPVPESAHPQMQWPSIPIRLLDVLCP